MDNINGIEVEDVNDVGDIDKISQDLDFNYVTKLTVGDIIIYLLDIMITPLIYILILLVFLSPITYIFNDNIIERYPNSKGESFIHRSRNKFIVLLEIIAELSFIMIALILTSYISSKINIFNIYDKNHKTLKMYIKLIYSALAIMAVHSFLNEKLEYVFSSNKSKGLFG